jgi:hypothetical protein
MGGMLFCYVCAEVFAEANIKSHLCPKEKTVPCNKEFIDSFKGVNRKLLRDKYKEALKNERLKDRSELRKEAIRAYKIGKAGSLEAYKTYFYFKRRAKREAKRERIKAFLIKEGINSFD